MVDIILITAALKQTIGLQGEGMSGFDAFAGIIVLCQLSMERTAYRQVA